MKMQQKLDVKYSLFKHPLKQGNPSWASHLKYEQQRITLESSHNFSIKKK